MLFREIVALCSEIHTKHITLLDTNQLVPRSEHYVSVVKTSQLMLYREIIAVLRSTQNTQIHCVGRT
jgi:hypothetical protein